MAPGTPDGRGFWDRVFRGLADAEERFRERLAEAPPPSQQLVIGFLGAEGRPLRVLEIGCGTGTLALRLAREGHRVTAVDISEEAVGFARRLAAGLAAVTFEVAGADRLPYADASFEAVVAAKVLDHLDRAGLERAAAEIRRVLAPGGAFLATFDPPLQEVPGAYCEPEDGTRVYAEGEYEGMVWRPVSDDELRRLFAWGEQLELETTADGERRLGGRRPGG